MAENIFLFVPNIIGYIRVGLAFLACYLWLTHPLTVAIIFVISQMVLDDLDGIAARRFNQATIFGGVLDIMIDRCSLMIFLMGLCSIYPEYMLVFQLAGYLDVSRMWMRMHSCALLGQKGIKTSSSSGILNFYYSELGLHIFSYGSELFYVALYLLYFSTGPIDLDAVYILILYANSLVMLYHFILYLVIEANKRVWKSFTFGGFEVGLWQILAAVTFPIVCIKQLFNIVILGISCQDIAAIDLAKRGKHH